jgi:hypothetical protein
MSGYVPDTLLFIFKGGFFVKEIWDLTNRKFGKLTAIEDSGDRAPNGGLVWKCKCDCGNYHLVRGDSLKSGFTKSCGCVQKETAKKINPIMRQEHFDKLVVEGTLLSALKETRKLNKNNTSGVKGVSWNKSKKKWDAKIWFKGKGIYLGRFPNKQDAITARLEAEDKYFKPMINKYKELGILEEVGEM